MLLRDPFHTPRAPVVLNKLFYVNCLLFTPVCLFIFILTGSDKFMLRLQLRGTKNRKKQAQYYGKLRTLNVSTKKAQEGYQRSLLISISWIDFPSVSELET